jgi:ribosomal protein S18 acetylase RimI-like enzyme
MMNCRPATRADVPALHALVESAYRGAGSHAGWTTEAHLLDGQRTDAMLIAGMIADPAQVILVFEHDGDVNGCLTVERREGYGYIGMVSVRPTEQGGGLGRMMLERAEAYLAREWAMARARMTVIAQRPELIAWYQRRGYVLTGDTAPFPYGEPQFGAPKRDDLYFVILEKHLHS